MKSFFPFHVIAFPQNLGMLSQTKSPLSNVKIQETYKENRGHGRYDIFLSSLPPCLLKALSNAFIELYRKDPRN